MVVPTLPAEPTPRLEHGLEQVECDAGVLGGVSERLLLGRFRIAGHGQRVAARRRNPPVLPNLSDDVEANEVDPTEGNQRGRRNPAEAQDTLPYIPDRITFDNCVEIDGIQIRGKDLRARIVVGS